MEHVQQRRLSQVLAESLRWTSALHWGGEDANGLGTLAQRYFLEVVSGEFAAIGQGTSARATALAL